MGTTKPCRAAPDGISHTRLVPSRNRARFLIAQLLVALGRASRKMDTRPLLVGVDDLPDQPWRMVDERRWRTGFMGVRTPATEKARRIGSVTCWRSFEKDGASRWTWTQATRLACEEDAVSSLDGVFDSWIANRRARMSVVSQDEVNPFAFGADEVRGLQQRLQGDIGKGTALYLAWSKHDVLSAMACSSLEEDEWSWQEVTELARIQNDRISSTRAAQRSEEGPGSHNHP